MSAAHTLDGLMIRDARFRANSEEAVKQEFGDLVADDMRDWLEYLGNWR